MEYRLRPGVSWSFLQNSNHQVVKIVVLQKTP